MGSGDGASDLLTAAMASHAEAKPCQDCQAHPSHILLNRMFVSTLKHGEDKMSELCEGVTEAANQAKEAAHAAAIAADRVAYAAERHSRWDAKSVYGWLQVAKVLVGIIVSVLLIRVYINTGNAERTDTILNLLMEMNGVDLSEETPAATNPAMTAKTEGHAP